MPIETTPDASQEERLSRARAALKGVETRIGAAREAWDRPALPLTADLTELMPEGLRRGQVVAVTGATSLMLALAAEASRAGSWTAAIGMPTVGVVAAARRGIELSRLALIPHPGAQAADAVGACVDGMDVVLLGERLALSDANRRRIGARARERGGVVIAAGEWPAAHVRLDVVSSAWSGLGAGDGRLRERELTVAVGGRRAGATRRVRVLLDGDVGARWTRPGARIDVDEEVA
ncbi:hypothetical protein [Demequina activiva]|uniref:Uncharacterized protein n=1 Tax=Demequina activiva TaxID=1582364 RepID=A0A919Q4P0_9MICO|nr:hypothetical protein [Demequina activiva]GIG54443.1 hypothetical protein Dac01nite_11950 [Demequina activiva]